MGREHDADTGTPTRNRRKHRKIREEAVRSERAGNVRGFFFGPDFNEADRTFRGVSLA